MSYDVCVKIKRLSLYYILCPSSSFSSCSCCLVPYLCPIPSVSHTYAYLLCPVANIYVMMITMPTFMPPYASRFLRNRVSSLYNYNTLGRYRSARIGWYLAKMTRARGRKKRKLNHEGVVMELENKLRIRNVQRVVLQCASNENHSESEKGILN